MTDENAAPETAKPAVRMVTVAMLDANRVFHGAQEIPEDQVTGTHVLLPNGCDLEPGKYRHDDEKGAFVPTSEVPPPEENPETLRNLALGFISLHDQGLTLPPETLKWLDWFTTSLDFQGVLGEQTSQMVQRFMKRKGG